MCRNQHTKAVLCVVCCVEIPAVPTAGQQECLRHAEFLRAPPQDIFVRSTSKPGIIIRHTNLYIYIELKTYKSFVGCSFRRIHDKTVLTLR